MNVHFALHYDIDMERQVFTRCLTGTILRGFSRTPAGLIGLWYGTCKKRVMKKKIIRLHRMLLHLKCAVRDHHWAWHWKGIRREMRPS